MRAVAVLAGAVVLESLRRKDLWVVAILGFLIILSAGTLGVVGLDGLQIFAKDLAVTVLGTFGTALAILTSVRLIPDEIRNRTLYPLLARPITRWQFLAGKTFGAIVVSWIAFLMLCALAAIALAVFRVQFEPILLQYVAAKMLGLALVCTITIALSTWSTPPAAATLSAILVFGSSMIVRALLIGYAGASPTGKFASRLTAAVLPQTNLFDLGGRAVYLGWSAVPLWTFGGLLVYAALYGGSMMTIAWVRLHRQAL